MKSKKQTGMDRAKASLIALSLLASTSAGFVGGWLGSRSYQHQASVADQQTQSLLNESDVVTKIAENVGPSVVSINVISKTSATNFFGFTEEFNQASAGTGFILSKDGIVLTNRHVVPEGVDNVSIVLADGTELKDVEVLGRTAPSDPLDIAFLKIHDTEGKDLVPVSLGSSSDMKVGQKVVAIGNALGQFQNSVTTGILSGFGRSITARDASGSDTLQNLFQTDAAINQGNSGGPLVNINGKVIGINTAAAGGSAENIGFAIPIDDIKGLITSVLEKGTFERPYLGVRYIQLSESIAAQLDIDQQEGAYIVAGRRGENAIAKNSPAEKAGLQEGDIILSINGTKISKDNTLVTLVGKNQVGDEITLKIIREGKEKELKVQLQATPDN